MFIPVMLISYSSSKSCHFDFRFFSGCYALMIVITQDTMGDLKFPAAYGSLLFVEALGVMLGPPVAGILKDISGNYDSSLYISGSLLIISGTRITKMTRRRFDGVIRGHSFDILASFLLLLPHAKRQYAHQQRYG